MNDFLPHLHAELRRTRLTMRGATHRPEDVPIGLHKEYARMEKISLPEPHKLDCTVQEAIERRRSTTYSKPGMSLTLDEIGTLLGSALRRHEHGARRMYPSGGGLYPVETYMIATQIENLPPSVLHYNPTAHTLERLWNLPQGFDIKDIAAKPEDLYPSVLIVFTSVWHRSSAKYGDLSYLHALLEAGHMSENILLLSSALDLEARPYAGFNDEEIIRLLDLNEKEEQPVHSITLSKVPLYST